ncbi:transposase [Streptomyces sp. NPDC050636]|uniref:transposase n=1 Tax=Streptomyces sp. NPDC050636 TaxID=3154510 RepID=UPI00343AF042
MPKNVGRGGRWKSHRRVSNGILFRQRTGVPWRDLPARFGKWKTVRDRHRRWSADGTWERIPRAVQADADVQGQRRGSAGGRPTGFNKTVYKRRNEVERTINALKGFRAVATRFDKRAYAFRGTVAAVAIRLWLRS